MADLKASDVLNRVMTILSRSFPAYLKYAAPHIGRGNARAIEVLESITREQERLCRRIGDWLDRGGDPIRIGDFPLEYTYRHDLSLDYLVRVMIADGRQDVAALGACCDQLRLAPAALALAEEARGLAEGHLELLEELAAEPASAA